MHRSGFGGAMVRGIQLCKETLRGRQWISPRIFWLPSLYNKKEELQTVRVYVVLDATINVD